MDPSTNEKITFYRKFAWMDGLENSLAIWLMTAHEKPLHCDRPQSTGFKDLEFQHTDIFKGVTVIARIGGQIRGLGLVMGPLSPLKFRGLSNNGVSINRFRNGGI